ncbi:MAG: hypothetical protein SGJ20_07040 [Planctomycetota bacterium]|nr:hypothetical protein [Planctomycetota bacterium]
MKGNLRFLTLRGIGCPDSPDDDEQEADVINLMDALRQSVRKTKAAGHGRRKVSRPRTSKMPHRKRRRTA